MKFNTVARVTAALLLSLTACLGFTACSRDYTVGFLYVLNTKPGSATDPNGTISEFGIDYQTGALLQLPSSLQTTQGRNPVSLVISPNQKNVYVVNHDDSNIASYLIGTDGKLYPSKVTSLDGVFPTWVAISSDGGYLYVSFTYRRTTATANNGPGGVEVYKLVPRTDGSGGIDIGAAVSNAGLPYFPVGVAPVQVAVGPNISNDGTRTVNPTSCVTTPTSCSSYVYVIDQDPSTLANLLVFSRNVGTGALTPIPAVTIGAAQAQGYLSGVTASSVAVAPRGVFVYVTDSASNQIIGYTAGPGGTLTAMTNGPFATGSLPVNMTIDPRGAFLYTVDQNDSALSAYTINSSTGSLSAVAGTAKPLVEGNTPNCVTIENALGVYLYVSNFVSNTVSGFQLNSTTGALSKIRNSPYPGTFSPSCVAAIANATHASAVQSIQ